MDASFNNGLDRLQELDRRYLRGNVTIACVIAVLGVFLIPTHGWQIAATSAVPLFSAILGLLGLRKRWGLVRWHVVHLGAVSASMVGSALITGATQSPVFEIVPVAGLLWVSYFPERRIALAAAPVMALAIIAVGGTNGEGSDVLHTVIPLIGSLVIPLFALRLVESELLYRRRAVIDQLTGCLNRHAFAARIAELQEQLILTNETIGVVMFDVDHFKTINDTHGHGVGDQALTDMCYAIRKRLRRFELFYRIGGEEFVILLAGADPAESRQLADSIREAVRTVEIGQQPITVSCGVAIADAGLSIPEAVELADAAMYQAKRSGRDCTVVHAPGAVRGVRVADEK